MNVYFVSVNFLETRCDNSWNTCQLPSLRIVTQPAVIFDLFK